MLVGQLGDVAPFYQLITLAQKGITHLVPPIDNRDICQGMDLGLFHLAHGEHLAST